MLGRVLPTGGTYRLTRRSYQICIVYRCRGSSHTATVLGYSYNCQTAVCTDTCPNQLMQFCPCNGVMRRLASRFRTRKTCSKRHSLPPNKHGGFVATQCHVRCDVMPSSRMSTTRTVPAGLSTGDIRGCYSIWKDNVLFMDIHSPVVLFCSVLQ